MTGCKHTHWKLLGALAAIAVLIPRLAVGEVGVCPPYSQTFGPGDPPEDIVAFMNSASTRPGGATVKLLPGEYELVGLTDITGVLCIEGLVEEGGSAAAITDPSMIVGTGGMLTARSAAIDDLTVRSGATLFAKGYGRTYGSGGDQVWPIGFVVIEAGGFAQVEDFTLEHVENAGTLLLSQGIVHEDTTYGSWGVFNEGVAFIDQAHVYTECGHYLGCGTAGIGNSGVLTVMRSTVSAYAYAEEYAGASGIGNNSGGVVYLVASTVAQTGCSDQPCDAIGIENDGGLVEINQSVVAENGTEDCVGGVTDMGHNVFAPGGGCTVTNPTSFEADPLLMADSFELGAGSPAIDLIPLNLCEDIDGLGRARTDGDGDGMVECDAGALEYGYVGLEVDVRTTPYWMQVGAIDLATENTLFVAVFSDAHVDATTIDFDSIYVEDFDARVRGPGYSDRNGDGLVDLAFWYRLDRDLDLDCGDYDQRFEALTEDGQTVFGQLRFEATGCAP